MRKFNWFPLAILAAPFVFLALVYAGDRQPNRASEGICVVRLAGVTNAAAVQIWPVYISDPACPNPSQVETVCIFNADATATNTLFVASSSTIDDNAGWPIRASEKECYDVGANTKMYVFQADGQAPADVKGLVLR